MCASCVSYNVYRIDRHEKIIEVSDASVKNKQRLVIIAKRKAELLECDELKLLELTDTFIKCLCIYRP